MLEAFKQDLVKQGLGHTQAVHEAQGMRVVALETGRPPGKRRRVCEGAQLHEEQDALEVQTVSATAWETALLEPSGTFEAFYIGDEQNLAQDRLHALGKLEDEPTDVESASGPEDARSSIGDLGHAAAAAFVALLPLPPPTAARRQREARQGG